MSLELFPTMGQVRIKSTSTSREFLFQFAFIHYPPFFRYSRFRLKWKRGEKRKGQSDAVQASDNGKVIFDPPFKVNFSGTLQPKSKTSFHQKVYLSEGLIPS